jgi:hypothetical protein
MSCLGLVGRCRVAGRVGAWCDRCRFEFAKLEGVGLSQLRCLSSSVSNSSGGARHRVF